MQPIREPRIPRRQFGVIVSFTLPFLAACGGGSQAHEGAGAKPAVLAFSAIPDDNKSGLAERYGLVASYLTRELGIPVEYRPSSDYAASVESFKNGDVQLAWFGGVSSVQARQAVPGARAIAQGKVDPTFVSYFIAHQSTGIEPSDEFPQAMQGKTFTFGPRDSTSGRLMPEFYVRQHTGLAPEAFFGHPNKHSTGHDQTALEVQSGAVQCGALNYVTYDKLVKEGKIDPAVCRKVWSTPPYPDYNWTAHPLLEERYGAGFTEKLAQVLVGIQDAEVLKALDRPAGLIPAKNEDYAAIEETMRAIDMLR